MPRPRPLAALESVIEGLVERSLVAPLRGPIHPREIARRLTRAMNDGVVLHVHSRVAPNEYRVRLHPDDLSPMREAQGAIEGELARYVADGGARRGLTFLAPPGVRLVADADGARGTFAIDARVREPGAAPEARIDPRRPASGWYLEVAGQELPLPYGTLRLGRAPDCEVVLPSRNVSRYHAELILDAEGARLRDLGSTNGTTVDGASADGIPVRPGASIAFGDVPATLRRATADAASA